VGLALRFQGSGSRVESWRVQGSGFEAKHQNDSNQRLKVEGPKTKFQVLEQGAFLLMAKLTYVVSLTRVTMSLHLPSRPLYTAGALPQSLDLGLQSLESSRCKRIKAMNDEPSSSSPRP
jgi:hypothetical protein